MAAAAGVRRQNWQVRLSPEELELLEAIRAAALQALDRQEAADRWARGGRPPFVRSPRQLQGPAGDAEPPSTGGDA